MESMDIGSSRAEQDDSQRFYKAILVRLVLVMGLLFLVCLVLIGYLLLP